MRYEDGISTADESYWFGFLIGDGNLARGRNRITVVLQDRDYDHLLNLKSFFDNEGYIRAFQPGYTQYSIERKELTNNLRRVGLRPAKTYTINWEDIPYNYTTDFLRGLLDSDGTVFLKFPMAVLRWHGTESLMYGIRDFLDAHHVCKSFGKVRRDRGSYNFGVAGRWKVQELSNYLWLNATAYLNRKYDTIQTLRKLNDLNPRKWNKLSKDDVARILDLSRTHKQTEIAKQFGVSNSMICRILKGERYGLGR